MAASLMSRPSPWAADITVRAASVSGGEATGRHSRPSTSNESTRAHLTDAPLPAEMSRQEVLVIRTMMSLLIVALMLGGCGSDGSGSDVLVDSGQDAPGGDAEADTRPDSGPAPPVIRDACIEGEVPDAECYAQQRDPESDEIVTAMAIAERFMAEHAAESLAWNWEEGVLMVGILELYRVTQDASLLAYMQGWLDHHIDRGYQIIWSDSCPPAITAAVLYDITGEARYLRVVEDILEYLADDAPRSEEGGISHLGVVSPRLVTLWLDSLFMFGEVLVRWGEISGDADVLDEAEHQFQVFTELTQDADSGWMIHSVLGLDGAQEPDVFWARGNAWVTAAGHDYLRMRRLRGEEDAQVSAALDAQVAAIIASQDSSGLWWTVVNRPGETYLETSASALFAYGMARGYRYGFRNDEVLPTIASAVDGVLEMVEDDDQGRPVVTGTSIGTGVGGFDNYANVAIEDDVPYGVGAVILMLVEVSGLALPAPE